MGCGSSMDAQGVIEEPTNDLIHLRQNGLRSKNIVREYVRLDEEIAKLESTCPGPRMATAESWIDHLKIKRDELLGVEAMDSRLQQLNNDNQLNEIVPIKANDEQENDVVVVVDGGLSGQQNEYQYRRSQLMGGAGTVSYFNPYTTATSTTMRNEIIANTPTKDLANLAYTLGVISDAQKASTHEDFFANLSESALHLLTIRYYNEILDHMRLRLKTLMESYAQLNELYVNQDGIIAFISGGTYMSRLEEHIDAQLETARDIRDKLGSALEQWRICGMLLRASAHMATQMLAQWQQLKNIIDPKLKIQTALECRSTLHGSLISLDCAQLALPHVEFKYISNRQILTVKHCSKYMITDIVNLVRFEHSNKVFTSYESNVSKTSVWLNETFKKTLRKDFDKAQDTVSGLAKTLRNHRDEIFTAARK